MDHSPERKLRLLGAAVDCCRIAAGLLGVFDQFAGLFGAFLIREYKANLGGVGKCGWRLAAAQVNNQRIAFGANAGLD